MLKLRRAQQAKPEVLPCSCRVHCAGSASSNRQAESVIARPVNESNRLTTKQHHTATILGGNRCIGWSLHDPVKGKVCPRRRLIWQIAKVICLLKLIIRICSSSAIRFRLSPCRI